MEGGDGDCDNGGSNSALHELGGVRLDAGAHQQHQGGLLGGATQVESHVAISLRG